MGLALKKTAIKAYETAAEYVRPAAVAIGTVALAGQQAANAAAVDVADVVTDIGAQLVPIAAIGIAVLGVFVAVKAFKWVRKALS